MNLWALIYAMAAAQGLLLSVALWQRGAQAPANRLLAGWMLLVSVDLAVRVWAIADPGLHTFKILRLASMLPFLHASLFYLYVRSVIQGRGLQRADWRHALGFGVGLLMISDLLLMGRTELESVRSAYRAGAFSSRELLINLALFSWSIAYVAAAVAAIVRHRRNLRATRSDGHPGELQWLMLMAASQCLIWAIALGQWLLPVPWLSYRLIYASVAAWVLLVGYLSLLQARHGAPAISSSEPFADTEEDPPSAPHQAAVPASSLDEDPRSDELAARLDQLMNEHQLYRQPALGLATLARRSGYPEYLVSAVINRRFGVPFWDYVNRFRVEAARDCLLDADDQRTVLDIAYDVGFTSKSTFNAAFKRLLGETPSACRGRARAVSPAATRAAGSTRPTRD